MNKNTPNRHTKEFPRAPLSLVVFAATVLSIWLTLRVFGRIDRFIYFWPVNGIILGISLPQWKKPFRFLLQIAGALGVLVGGLWSGMPMWFALCITLLSAIDVWVSGTVLSRCLTTFADLKSRATIKVFCKTIIAVPLATGIAAAYPMARLMHESVLRSAAMSAMSNSIGSMLLLPAVLLLLTHQRTDKPLSSGKTAYRVAIIASFLATTLYIFIQTTHPVLSFVFLPLVLVALEFGLEGAVLSMLGMTAIACLTTSHGRGPLWLGIANSPESRLLMLQGFLWTATASVLPIGALFDERRRAQRQSEEARFRYETLLNHAEDMIVLSSLDGSERFVSPAVERLTGWTPEEFLAMPRLATMHPEDRAAAAGLLDDLAAGKTESTFRYRLLRKHGGWLWTEAFTQAYRDRQTGSIKGYIGTVRDISERIEREQAMQQEIQALGRRSQIMEELADTDPLTRLPNRRAFERALKQNHQSVPSIVMMIDIDQFKLFNDTYGHQRGDECLQQVAFALRSSVSRADDMIARIGGEEFAVVLPGSHLRGAVEVARTMLRTIRDLDIKHRASSAGVVTISIGIAERNRPACTVDDLVEQADIALYASKHDGRDRLSVFGLQDRAISDMPASMDVSGF